MAPLGLLATMVRAGIIAPLRPDKYLRIAAVVRREGLAVTSGFAMSAQRCPNRPALVDEIGALTFRELDRRADALAAGLQALPGAFCHEERRWYRGLTVLDQNVIPVVNPFGFLTTEEISVLDSVTAPESFPHSTDGAGESLNV